MVKAKIVVLSIPTGWGDQACDIAGEWFEELIPQLEAAGFTVYALRQDQCVDGPFHEAITQNDPIGFTGVGHGGGTPQRFTGWETETLLQQGIAQDAQLMKGRMPYFLSCEIGRELVPWLISQGMTAAIAYDESFWLVSGDDSKYFKYCSNKVVQVLLAGGTFDEAWLQSQAEFDRWIKELANNPFKRWVVDLLLADKKCQKKYGELTSKWTEEQEPELPVKCYWCDFQEDRIIVVKHMITEHNAYQCPPGADCWPEWITLGKWLRICK